jgi:uncharacterized protein
MNVDDQGTVIALLQGDSGGLGSTEQSIATHISRIFLKKDRVLKLKQAVLFPYVDYSTAEKRLAACHAELELNRRTAPELYLGVRTITREQDGGLTFDGAGVLVDAVVEMRRFAEEDLFDNMAQRGALTPAIMTELARRIAAFHKAAIISKQRGGAAGMSEVLDINDRSLQAASLVSIEQADRFAQSFRDQLGTHALLLESRREAGKVRRCHGDLILRNICLIDGVPTLFDCIEFSEALATVDVLYDLAFLLMDLWYRGQRAHANLVLNRYLDACDEVDGLPLMPFFMAVRAAVRAHVTAAQAIGLQGNAAPLVRKEALAYFDLASSLLVQGQTRLLAFGGFSGSGKSTQAAHVAPRIGLPPGARVLNSDRIRKRLHGVPAEEHLPKSAYHPEVSRQVYTALFEEAREALQSGTSVITDAVFDRSEDRAAIETLAREADVPFHGFWLEAPKDILVSRIEARVRDASDATADVLAGQLQHRTGVISWHRIHAKDGQTAVTKDILAAIGLEA